MDDIDRLLLPLDLGHVALPDGEVLVLNAAQGLPDDPRFMLEQGFRPLHDALAAEGRRVAPAVAGVFAGALVRLTRVRAEALGLMARALRMVAPGGPIIASGAKTDGVEPVLARLRAAGLTPQALAKAHGKAIWLTRPPTLPPEVALWAAEAAPRTNAEGFLTAPGMFSADAGDPGSVLLAAAVNGRLSGKVADLGAGYGWLARAVLADPGIGSLTLVEADHAALAAARVNVTDPRAQHLWADATGLAKRDGLFDHVITNPPFHTGRAAEPELGRAFLAAAARVLKPGGRLHLVANRQLPYEPIVERLFAERAELPGTARYKLLTASRPKPAR